MNTYHNTPEIINSIEKSLKQQIETFFLSVYPVSHLVSHGLEHHRRVWEYAKELISNSGISRGKGDLLFFRKIMIACYFHDIGMSADPGVRHGALSREQCTIYLRSKGISQTEHKDTLEAIEYHDDKDYTSLPSDNIILTILSVADDLDAFGFIGIFRYIEVYLKRNIPAEEIGYLISENASRRFDNFVNIFGSSSEYVQKQRIRFEILVNFFKEYNHQLSGYRFGTAYPSGYCGVMDVFISVHNNSGNTDFSNIIKIYSKDPVINWFNKGLSSELHPVRFKTQ